MSAEIPAARGVSSSEMISPPPSTVSSISDDEREQEEEEDEEEEESRSASAWRERLKPFAGPLLVLLSEAFGGGMAATTRALEMPHEDGSPGMHTLQILFARFSITAVLSILYMWWRNVEDAPLGQSAVRKWLVLRGCCGFCGVFGFYYSLQYLPMAEAIIIIFITPLMTAYASSLFLGEPFSRKQLFSGLVSFLGIIIVADPLGLSSKSINSSNPHDGSVYGGKVTAAQRFSAITLGILSDFAAAGAYTSMRIIGKRAHTLISVNYYAILTTVLSGFILAMPISDSVSFRLPHGMREWLLLLGIGVFGFLLQSLLTVALVMDKSSRATNMMYSQIVFAVLLDWMIWGTIPTWTSWFGGAIVVAAVVWGSMQVEQTKSESKNDAEYQAVPAGELELTNEVDSGRRRSIDTA